MLLKKKYTKHFLASGIMLVILIYPVLFNLLGIMSPESQGEGPIYNIAMAETSQQNAWKLCDEKQFPYELLLSVYHADGIENRGVQAVEEDIAALIYLRDYWDGKGYLDEDVFDLMILSWDMSIEGCKAYVAENPAYKDNEYLKQVSDYKYYLEQSLNTP